MAKKDEKSDASEQTEPTDLLAEEFAELEANQKHDETIPGGKYVVGGKLVNANGQAIDQAGNVLPGEAPVSPVLLPNAPPIGSPVQ